MGAWNGPLWIPAWQLHDRDPTLIMWKVGGNDSVYVSDMDSIFNRLLSDLCIQAVYNNMSGSAFRRNNMARLHVFPGEEVETFFQSDAKICSEKYISNFNLSFL